MQYQSTSREAWEQIKDDPRYDTVDARILVLLATSPTGMTDDAVEALTGMRHQTVSAQRRHLVQRGWVVNSGQRGQTRSGRAAILWKINSSTRLQEARG